MNQLQIFNFNDAQVRTVIKDGEPWFVLTDVCKVLDIGNPSDVKSRLEDGVVSIEAIPDSLGRIQKATIISEDGLYDVVLESRKPEARTFRKWVTSEVLPSIRKTGSYSLDKPKSQAELLLMYAQQFVEMEKRVEQVESKVEVIQETFLKRDEDWRNMINGLIKGASFRSGGNYRELYNKSYELLEERARCDLNTRLRNLRARLEESGATKTKINATTRLDVIENDPRLKEIYTSIVKEISIGTMSVIV